METNRMQDIPMTNETLSERFSVFVADLAYEHLTPEQVRKIKMYFLDWLGSAIAGSNQPPVRMMLNVVRTLGGSPEATVIPDGSRTNCLLSALVNGAASHVVEMDDLHRASILHPAAAIMPAVFAAAERAAASGRDLIVGLAAGYEVGIRLALAAGPGHYRYWHTTATCGTFGAAAGSAAVLGLDATKTTWALGSAGTQAAGLWEFLVESAMSKQLHAGKAAFNGLLSSLLAAEGFTGARAILEGDKGFFNAMSPDADRAACLEGLGDEFLFERNSLKYRASCGHTHSTIEALLQATGGRPLDPALVEAVDVHVYPEALDLLGKVTPTTPYVAKFHFPFCIATALAHGRVSPADFTAPRLEDPDINRLMKRVRLHDDPELGRAYPAKWPARVVVRLADGERLEGACEYPKGDPENPLTEAELIEKFDGLTAGLISHAAASGIVNRALDLENLDRADRVFEGIG
jgi:2-methylcitrate dehydratase PrpD